MKTFICLFLCLFTLQSFSQVDSSKFTGNFSLGGNYTGGNFNSYSLYSKSDISREWKKNQLSWSPNLKYSQISSNGIYQVREREVYSIFNYTRRLGDWKILFFNELSHSYLRKVDLRGSVGFGFGHKLINSGTIELDLSEIILPEFMISNFGKTYDNFALRSSTRLKFVYKKSNIKISSIVFYQPSLYTVRDENKVVPFRNNINFRSNTNFEVMVSKVTSVGLGNEVVYEAYSHSIDEKIKPLDYSIFFFVKFTK